MTGSDEALLAALDRLAPSFAESGIEELEVEAGPVRIRLARPRASSGTSTGAPAQPGAALAAPPVAVPPATSSPFGEPSPGMRFVTAPLTGIWYTAPSPGARPYIQRGSEVAAGAVVGLIEAMKLFNEIKTDFGGRVVRLLVESGTLVKRQQPLIEIDPS